MSNEQPEALRLADLMDRELGRSTKLTIEIRRLHEVNQDLLEALVKAVPIFEDSLHAIRKILVERDRGMGYFHAELDWLIGHEQEIRDLRKQAKNLIREAAIAKARGEG